jgi:hypothetical protein
VQGVGGEGDENGEGLEIKERGEPMWVHRNRKKNENRFQNLYIQTLLYGLSKFSCVKRQRIIQGVSVWTNINKIKEISTVHPWNWAENLRLDWTVARLNLQMQMGVKI